MGTGRNPTEIQLSELGSKMQASIATMVKSQSPVSSKISLGLQLIFSLIRLQSRPDLRLSQRLTSTWEIGGQTDKGARLVVTLSSCLGFLSVMGWSYQDVGRAAKNKNIGFGVKQKFQLPHL